jgi:2'-5' RNA ligase
MGGHGRLTRQYGIISVLDGTHFGIVRAIWDEIDRTIGQRSLVPHPYPHFTYQAAEAYDLRRLDAALQALAARTTPFRVSATGLAVFNEGGGVYLGVGRTPALNRFHAEVWQEAAGAAVASLDAERSVEKWVPHITLTLGSRMRERIPDVVRLLYERDLSWDFEINNLTVVYEDETHKELVCRHDFAGALDPAPPLV